MFIKYTSHRTMQRISDMVSLQWKYSLGHANQYAELTAEQYELVKEVRNVVIVKKLPKGEWFNTWKTS